MRSLLFFTLVFTIELYAVEESSCMEKLEELDRLKTESASGIERTAAFLFTANWTAFSKSEDEKLRKEKIRVLEMELESCQ